jgi:hypothetical protein
MPDKDADDPAPAKAGGGTGALTSGCDGDGQKSRRPDFLGNELAVGLKTCDVNLDGPTARSRHSSIVLPRVKQPGRAGTVTK